MLAQDREKETRSVLRCNFKSRSKSASLKEGCASKRRWCEAEREQFTEACARQREAYTFQF